MLVNDSALEWMQKSDLHRNARMLPVLCLVKRSVWNRTLKG